MTTHERPFGILNAVGGLPDVGRAVQSTAEDLVKHGTNHTFEGIE